LPLKAQSVPLAAMLSVKVYGQPSGPPGQPFNKLFTTMMASLTPTRPLKSASPRHLGAGGAGEQDGDSRDRGGAGLHGVPSPARLSGPSPEVGQQWVSCELVLNTEHGRAPDVRQRS